jgi:hypothetical protein
VARLLPTGLVAAVVVVLAIAPGAMASVSVGSGASRPTLKVDAKGNAEITYMQGKTRMIVFVPVKGAVIYGRRLRGKDVTKAATRPKLPYVKVLRRGRGGWFYALQTWPARIGAPELRFSRWKGKPTKLTFKARRENGGVALAGTVTYAGKPIPIKSRVPGGTAVREYVYLDQRVGGKWKVLGAVSVNRKGTYKHVLYGGTTGSRLRAIVAGPNIGTVYAPDMVRQIPPP